MQTLWRRVLSGWVCSLGRLAMQVADLKLGFLSVVRSAFLSEA
jgi:hypothetical protein